MAGTNGTSTASAALKTPWKETEEGRQRDFKSVKSLPYEAKLRELFGGIAGGCRMMGDNFSGQLIEMRAEELAYSYARLAGENENVRRIVKALTEGSVWAETVMLSLSVAVPIAWRYGFVPDSVGQTMAVMSNVMPMTREQEEQLKAEEAAATATAGAKDGDSTGASGGE